MKHSEMLLSKFETASFSIETVTFAIGSGKSYRNWSPPFKKKGHLTKLSKLDISVLAKQDIIILG